MLPISGVVLWTLAFTEVIVVNKQMQSMTVWTRCQPGFVPTNIALNFSHSTDKTTRPKSCRVPLVCLFYTLPPALILYFLTFYANQERQNQLLRYYWIFFYKNVFSVYFCKLVSFRCNFWNFGLYRIVLSCKSTSTCNLSRICPIFGCQRVVFSPNCIYAETKFFPLYVYDDRWRVTFYDQAKFFVPFETQQLFEESQSDVFFSMICFFVSKSDDDLNKIGLFSMLTFLVVLSAGN